MAARRLSPCDAHTHPPEHPHANPRHLSYSHSNVHTGSESHSRSHSLHHGHSHVFGSACNKGCRFGRRPCRSPASHLPSTLPHSDPSPCRTGFRLGSLPHPHSSTIMASSLSLCPHKTNRFTSLPFLSLLLLFLLLHTPRTSAYFKAPLSPELLESVRRVRERRPAPSTSSFYGMYGHVYGAEYASAASGAVGRGAGGKEGKGGGEGQPLPWAERHALMVRQRARAVAQRKRQLQYEPYISSRGPSSRVVPRQGDEWCGHLPDGLHADHSPNSQIDATILSRVYFKCRHGSLSGLFLCPDNLVFCSASSRCTPVPSDTSSCLRTGVEFGHHSFGFTLREGGSGESGSEGGAAHSLDGGRRGGRMFGGRPSSSVRKGRKEESAVHGGGDGAGEEDVAQDLQRRVLAGGATARSTSPVTWDQVNALLDFKSRVVDPVGELASWVVPRPTATATRVTDTTASSNSSSSSDISTPPGTDATAPPPPPPHPLGPPPNVCTWNAVQCSPAGAITGIVLDPNGKTIPGMQSYGGGSTGSQVSGHLGTQSIPPSFSTLTALEALVVVAEVQLAGLVGLTGQIPVELSACRHLSLLTLSDNRLSGGLGDGGLSLLTALKVLNLPSNLIQGPIPPEWLSAMSGLTSLNLQGNLLGGSIPPAISHLANLVVLSLQGTRLTGSIPTEIGALTKLGTGTTEAISLALGFNLLSGNIPAALGSLKSVVSLDLSWNNLTGPVPMALTAMSKLMYVDVSNNNLTGAMPWLQLCRPTMSFGLVLANNSFTGRLDDPDFTSNCASPLLSTLQLDNNRIEGGVPESFVTVLSMTYINTFTAPRTGLTGALPAALTKIVGLGFLDLSDNALEGPLPPFTCPPFRGAGLRDVFLFGNRFTGPIPEGLVCNVINALDLSNNRLTGRLPKGLATFEPFIDPTFASTENRKIELWLGGNKLTGPAVLPKNCTFVAVIDLHGNQLSGAFPSLKGCDSLVHLDVSANNLSGSIPPDFSHPSMLQLLNLSGNAFSGSIPSSIGRLRSLASLSLEGNNFSGPIPSLVSALDRLQLLSLSGNRFTSIPPSLANVTVLSSLDVSRNNISGPIPPQLAPPFLPRLRLLNLSHNSFNGTIPYGFASVDSSILRLDLSSNQLCGSVPEGNLTSTYPPQTFANNTCTATGGVSLCGGPGLAACPVPPPPPPASNSLSAGAIAGIVVGSFVALLLLLLLLWYLLFGRKPVGPWDNGSMIVFEHLDFKLTVKHILTATDNFDDKYMLGRGGFGSVYRATFSDGRTVAIKRLAAGSGQGQREFEAEVRTLGSIRHRNLVTLVAAYVAKPPSPEKLLIYDFLPGGSLDHILARDMPPGSPFRRWEVRRTVLLDTARGLKYLHHDCTPRIIHRDMKPANVLLDADTNAKVADFGLAREMEAGQSHKSTAVFGTIGYLAPEYTLQGRLSFKSDVFAFGVLVLQMLTGKQPSDEDVAERGLARWVGAHSVLTVCDQRIDDREAWLDEIGGVLTIGMRCTSRVAADRPTMAEATHLLENLRDYVKGVGT